MCKRSLRLCLRHPYCLPAESPRTIVKAWFDAGVTAVGVGSFVTKAAQADGDYSKVTSAAETFLAAISEARK
ncbi:hypothetical protein [Cryobacterium sp. 10C3]|uniref:hypothetical protein n=1 Tax=Cryobacterium sp. 10C3 TaxID=3048577 RepID=UPI002AB46385|nr:hypothetical protein [Cryobacterium sp. 10C3]MDY7556904.1 hypothetical protein [Cryobacterium sp. 10C3]